jgi:predicted DNA-binding WGR domain protein
MSVFIGIIPMVFLVMNNTQGPRPHSVGSPFVQSTEKTGRNAPQVIDLISIDPSRNRHRIYRIIRRGTVVSTMHGRQGPGERPYLKRAKAPQKFDCEEDAAHYVAQLIRAKVDRRTDPYTVVDSSEAVQ